MTAVRLTHRRTDAGLVLVAIDGVPIGEMTDDQVADVLYRVSTGWFDSVTGEVEA